MKFLNAFILSLYVILGLILTSCGSDKGTGKVPENAQTSTAPLPDNNPTTKTTAQPNISTSYYVATEADLKACDGSTRGYLAYVKKSEEFKACVEEGWVTVDVRGKDGAKGKDGSNGSNGAVVAANDSTWVDPITGVKWYIGSLVSAYVGHYTGCGQGLRMPTSAEAKAATLNGLTAAVYKIANSQMLWLPTDLTTTTVSWIDTTSPSMDRTSTLGNASVPVSAAIVCLKN